MAKKQKNGNTATWIRIAIGLVTTLVIVAIAYGRITQEQKQHCERIEAVEAHAQAQDATISRQEKAIGRVEGQVEYIKDTVDEINAVQRQVLRELQK